MKVKIVSTNPEFLPKYQTDGSAGMDLYANCLEPVTLKPMERKLIPTGIFIALPNGFEAQIRPRSGLALKHGITITNSPATIDSDFRGECQVLLQNLGSENFIIQQGDRIAQMVIAKYEVADWQSVEKLDETSRGIKGFGSTGK